MQLIGFRFLRQFLSMFACFCTTESRNFAQYVEKCVFCRLNGDMFCCYKQQCIYSSEASSFIVDVGGYRVGLSMGIWGLCFQKILEM